MNKGKYYFIYFLTLSNITFISLVLYIGYYNRFASDDIGFIYLGNKNGALADTIKNYMIFDGRFFVQYFSYLVAILLQNYKSLILFTLFTFSTLIASLYFLLKRFSELYIKQHISIFSLLSVVILLCNCFFFMTFNIGEVWFWVNGTIVYMWPLIIFFSGASLLLKKKSSVISISLCSLLMFIYGFSSINYLAITLPLYALFILYLRSSKSNGFKNHISKPQVYIPLIFLLIGCVLMIIAPGNYQRRSNSFEPETTLFGIFTESFSSIKHFVKVILTQKLFLLFSFLGAFSLVKCVSITEEIKISKAQFIRGVLVCTSLIGLSFLIHSITMAVATGWIGQERVWTILSLILALGCLMMGILLSLYLTIKSSTITSILGYGVLMVIIYINISTLHEQYPIVSEYADSVDERLAYFEQLKSEKQNDEKVFYIEPLAPSGILYSQDLSKDSLSGDYHYHKCYLKFSGIKFSVFVK